MMQPAQSSKSAPAGTFRLQNEMPVLVWAASTLGAHRAVVVCTEVNCLAAERAAVVDKRLVLLDGHVEYWFDG